MRMRSLRRSIAHSFILVIGLLGVSVTLLGYYVIRYQIIDKAQTRVREDLKAAHAVFRSERAEMARAFSLVSHVGNLAQLRSTIGLDYLYVVDAGDSVATPSEVVSEALKGNPTVGVRIIQADELRSMGGELFERAAIDIRQTPKARPSSRTRLEAAMTMECALPFIDSAGRVQRVIYGGRIVNRYFDLVDRVRDIVYENRLYKGKPVGTVTLFLDDVRVTTNVLDEQGRPAVGTRVSEAVYRNVVEQGKVWQSRAFVVTDWYLTSYEPIWDVKGRIIGILYVGVLERPYRDMQRSLMLALLGLVALSMVVAVVLSLLLTGRVTRPVTELVNATSRLSEGDLTYRARHAVDIREMAALLDAFNEMAGRLKQREDSLQVTNAKLAELNTTYLDLVGMVSHELKGILATTMLNAYSLRDGFLGMVNFKQKKALNSITRNLDYFDATVRNFLSLSRIEKDELSLHVMPFALREEVVDAAVEAFARQAQDRGMAIVNEVEPALTLQGDASLVQIVLNNLVGNAVKYGAPGGRVALRSTHTDGLVQVEVYNDGRPLASDEQQKLFRRFSRLDSPEGRRVRGTGIGLFITRQIVERHGGTIRVEAREQGNAFVFTLPLERPASGGEV